ncbi:hypothetical protein QMN58_28995, partial [Escherichia coli]|nr:hypothetical protein [Escherichia coli]
AATRQRLTKIITNSASPGCAANMRTRADESLAVWGGANGPPGSVFLAQRLARQFGTISCDAAEGGAASSHRGPHGPFLIRLAGPASPAEFF